VSGQFHRDALGHAGAHQVPHRSAAQIVTEHRERPRTRIRLEPLSLLLRASPVRSPSSASLQTAHAPRRRPADGTRSVGLRHRDSASGPLTVGALAGGRALVLPGSSAARTRPGVLVAVLE
jgi:hypothetical protein